MKLVSSSLLCLAERSADKLGAFSGFMLNVKMEVNMDAAECW